MDENETASPEQSPEEKLRAETLKIEEDAQLSLFKVEKTWETHWKGMPEFTHKDCTALYSVVVNFATDEDLAAFAKLVEQTITPNTIAIWYPPTEIGRYADKLWIDSEEEK